MDEETGLLSQTQVPSIPKHSNVPNYFPSHRLVNRNGPLHQSSGKIYVKKRIKQADWWALYGNDWFHSLVDAPTLRVVGVLFGVYIATVAVFSVVYFLIHETYFCELTFDTWIGAFDFSLETMATIGYSTNDITFANCWIVTAVLTLQCCIRLIVDGVTIGIIYCRLARPHSRASTIIFSKYGIIRRIRGKLYFMFQLCELRKHQLVEAHVRLYAIRKESDPTGSIPYSYLQTSAMRLNHPNDELGSMLLLMVPQVVVHELDFGSPLMAPPVWREGSSGQVVRWTPPCYRGLKRRNHANESSATSPTPLRRRQTANGGHAANPLHPPLPSHSAYGTNNHLFPIASDNTMTNQTPPLITQPHTSSSADNLLSFDAEALSSIEFPNVIKRSAGSIAFNAYPPPADYQEGDAPTFSSPSNRGRAASSAHGGLTPPRRQSLRNPMPRERTPPRDRKREILPLLSPPPINSFVPEERLESPGMNLYSQEMQSGGMFAPYQHGEEVNNGSYSNGQDSEAAWQVEEKKMIQRFLSDRRIEIIAIVEGVDSATGGNVQARQSYTCEEIEWDKGFEYCMFEDPDDGVTTIDFDLFHKLREVPKDAAFSGAIPSCI